MALLASKIENAIKAVSKKQPFLTAMLYELTRVEADYIDTMATDGEHLFYNKKFTESLSAEETAGVVYHEVLHCAHDHIWRKGDKNHTLWNMACDYSINPTVVEDFKLPKGVLLDMKYYGMSAEEIYERLKKEHRQWFKQQSQQDCDNPNDGKKQKGSGQGKGKAKDSKPEEQKWGEHDYWDEKSKKKKEAQYKKGKGKPPTGQRSPAERRRRWKNMRERDLLQNYGKLPASMQRQLSKEYYIPVIDWSSLVINLLSEDQSDYSFAAPDRRYLDGDFILPDLESKEMVKDVIFAFDTSGSISESMLKSFFEETKNIFEHFYQLQGWTAICDAYLHDFRELNSADDVMRLRFMGGGGTSFVPVFDEIKKRSLKPKALFYFTDTYGSCPREEPDYPVFWLVPSSIGDTASYSLPFGTIVKFLPKGGV